MPNRSRPRGFTLIEALVATAIISVLMALMLPAVHQAREAARRAQCRNQLRQLAIGLHSYHSDHAVLPAGAIIGDWSWKAFILPQIDQAALYSQINFGNNFNGACYTCMPEQLRLAGLGKPHPDLAFVPVLYCPSDPRSGGVYQDAESPLPYRLGSYLGVSGDSNKSSSYSVCPGLGLPAVQPDNGVLGYASKVRLEHVTDGTSQTMMIGERGIDAAALYSSDFCTNVWGPWLPAIWFQPGGNGFHANHYWSWHQGGALFAFADGSVHFLNYSMSGQVYRALATYAGNEVVGEY